MRRTFSVLPRFLLIIQAAVIPGMIRADFAAAGSAAGREPARFEGERPEFRTSSQCLLQSYDNCSCWVWILRDAEGAVWGTVLDPDDCPGGCASGGSVSDIWFWSQCAGGSPATIGGVGVATVDPLGCPTGLLWSSGPLTVYNCTGADHWTHVTVPTESTWVEGDPFAITFEWGPEDPRVQLVTDSGIANLICWSEGTVGVFPGCESLSCTCAGWGPDIPPQVTYQYITDLGGELVDLCDIYGYPYPLSFPYHAPYGYLPNNLIVIVGLDCSAPASVGGGTKEYRSSWGRIKSLYE